MLTKTEQERIEREKHRRKLEEEERKRIADELIRRELYPEYHKDIYKWNNIN